MDSTQIRFSGSGGQGLILSARILATTLVESGLNVAQSQSYEPVSRGGQSRADLVVTRGEAAFPLGNRLDYLLILDGVAAQSSNDLLHDGTLVITDSDLVPEPPAGDFPLHNLPFTATALKLGYRRVANIVALGALAALSDICSKDTLQAVVETKTPAKFARLNMEALDAGHELVG